MSDPDYTDTATAKAWFDRGNAFTAAGNLPAALDAFRRAIKLNARVAAPWIALAQLLGDNGQQEDARACLRNAVVADPTHALARLRLAHAHQGLGHLADAEREFRAALRLDPRSAAAQVGLGQLLEDIGNPLAAADAYRAALAVEPSRAEALANLLGLARHVDVAPELARARMRLERGDCRERALVGYGLGKALEQDQRHAEAFSAYAAANAARREAAGGFDRDEFDRRIAAMIALFSSSYFAARRDWGDASNAPVFIVGLPRSGTTLTEQIIASHPACFGAGELNVLTDLATGMPDRLGKADPPWPLCAGDANRAQTAALARDYLRRSAERAPASACRIVDKQPLNFWHLGLIATALPNARIIHCTRDIRDCGFSIYTQNFNVDLRWATDLGDIAYFWRGYRRLMQHWSAVTGLQILECAYEDTVVDLETQARRLLAFCGLPWDDRVLDFHRNARAVQTPSRWQVREPLYRSSLARWRHYEAELGPLREASAACEDACEVTPSTR